MDSKYKNPDNDPKGAWRNIVASAPGAATHQGMVYAIQNPLTGDFAYPPQGRCWSLGQDQMLNAMNEWCNYELKDLHDIEKRAEMCGVSKDEVKKDVLAIVIKDDLETAKQKVLNIFFRAFSSASLFPAFATLNSVSWLLYSFLVNITYSHSELEYPPCTSLYPPKGVFLTYSDISAPPYNPLR